MAWRQGNRPWLSGRHKVIGHFEVKSLNSRQQNAEQMNQKLRSAIRSLRLRTLPLSLGGVVLGALLAASDFVVSPWVMVLLFLTTVFLQILSNLSNELGDVLNGTDTPDRQGPDYGIAEGGLSVSDMKRLISAIATACALSGCAMIWVSFGTLFSIRSISLLILGALAIIAAMRYTLGPSPYGYRGLGDIAVFIFFGLVSVLGGYYVCAHTIISPMLILPAAAVGFFSVGVLNVNNIRDMKTDSINRVTVAIKLGLKGSRIYQTVLIALGWILLVCFTAVYKPSPWHYLFLIVFPLHLIHLKGIWSRKEKALDPMLPLLVMSTFLLCLILGISFIAF